MRVSYHADYFVELPPNHPFPMRKFPALCEILLAEGLIRWIDIVEPEEATWDDLRLAHREDYLCALLHGTLDPGAQRKLGVPWSPRMFHRSRLAVQGTLNSAEMALEDGIAANLAGGTHHAFPDHGEGYCVLNDVAVTIRVLQQRRIIRNALVIDLDVHQGNGTAALFEGDETVYTFSMHGEKNYPWKKAHSTLDVELPDRATDELYLDTLGQHLPGVISAAKPDLVFYLAGVDPMQGDRFGRLSMTREGIHERDRRVMMMCRHHGLPVTLLLSGGYAKTPDLTADLHAIAHREAQRVLK